MENLKSKLAPFANSWMKVLNIETKFPDSYQELQSLCRQNNQLKPTPSTIFSLFFNGKFVTTDLSVCMDSRFYKVIVKK